MKIFVYKTLFIFLMIILLFHFTVGPILKNVEQKISNINSKENVEYMKDKIRDELSEEGIEIKDIKDKTSWNYK